MSVLVQSPTRPFAPAEVVGLSPDDAGDGATAATLRDALATHALLCIHLPSKLSDEEARAIASIFGRIKDPIGRARDGSFLRYGEDRQIIDAGFVLTEELRAELGDLSFGGLDDERPGLFETFHTDDSYTDRPASATVLHARELPSGPGGATNFIDMRAAYQMLDVETRESLIGLRAVHAYNNHNAFPPRVAAEGPLEMLVEVSHPVVRAHPVTGGPALYFDLDRAMHIEGLPERDGRELLQSLQDHAEAHAPRYAHSWRANDVLIWDNASVQHKASGDFPVGEPRRFWRYMIEGTEPVAFVSRGAANAPPAST
jgi:alpha-ketoglutarate-dependent taurine dioxygenase